MKKHERNSQSLPDQKNADINKGEQRIGRANQDDAYDISHMDRQEGTMHHGELGGNFECAEDKEHGTPHRNEDTNK